MTNKKDKHYRVPLHKSFLIKKKIALRSFELYKWKTGKQDLMCLFSVELYQLPCKNKLLNCANEISSEAVNLHKLNNDVSVTRYNYCFGFCCQSQSHHLIHLFSFLEAVEQSSCSPLITKVRLE